MMKHIWKQALALLLVGKLGREINMNVLQNIETYF